MMVSSLEMAAVVRKHYVEGTVEFSWSTTRLNICYTCGHSPNVTEKDQLSMDPFTRFPFPGQGTSTNTILMSS